MRILICESCGSNDLERDGAFFVCRYCGTRMVSDVPAAASINNDARIAEILKRADLYWKHGRKAQAASLYRQVLELDATCEVARQRVTGR